ncbi:MAG TPA: MFS transporter [Xanthobacteraceae bacterium]|nr:MFS transporter [Xanthobacteraceae bacterium]
MTETIDAATATPRERYQLLGTPALGLAMGTWGFFVGFAAVALYGPAAKYFQEQMHLGGLALGLLVAAPQLTGSLLRIPFGAWVDRVGGRLPMLTLFGLSLVGMWGLVFILLTVKTLTVAAYPIVIMFGFLSGCGVASFSVGIPQVSYWFPQSRQGTALGAYGGIGNLAPGIFTLLLPYAIASWGLSGSYFAWFTFLLIGTAVYAWLARDAYFFQLRRQGFDAQSSRKIAAEKGQELFPNERVWQAVITAAEDPRTWGLVALYFVSFGGFLALTVWFPTYWINLHHMDVKSAAALGGLGFSLLAAVIRVFGGMISERVGGERTAVLAFLAVLAGASMLTYVEDFSLALGGELLIALGMGVANAAVFKMVPKYVPDAVGGAAGIVGGLGALGGFIIPPFLGAVVDALGVQGYAGGFFAYMVLAVMAIGVSGYFWYLDRRSKKTTKALGPAMARAR